MICLRSHSNDPFFNLAAEEYLLKNYNEDIYFQYVNSPSVVIGKHQNALAEIDVDYLQKEGILLARRISGGGAVYHDYGNVNYSFLTTESVGDFIQFKKYTAPIIEILRKLGVKASLGKRNEILVGTDKISGTASHIFKSRALHHGTLLFNADLDRLAKCLYVNADRFTDKSVKSVRSQVVNIIDILEEKISEKTFYDFLFASILEFYEESEAIELNQIDITSIEKIRDEKFTFWEWNYGYSPRYIIENEYKSEGKTLRFKTTVEKGLIKSISIEGTLSGLNINSIEKQLIGMRHERREIEDLFGIDPGNSESVKILIEGIF